MARRESVRRVTQVTLAAIQSIFMDLRLLFRPGRRRNWRNPAPKAGSRQKTMSIQAPVLTKAIAGVAAASWLLGAQVAFADPGRWRGDERADGYRDQGYDYARVVNVEPIVRNVRITTPRRECWNETRYDEVRYDDGPREPRQAAGSMILGGLIGAAVGHNFGHGDGRRVATAVGAVVGTAIGHDAAARRDSGYSSRQYSESRPYDVERCNVRYDEEYERRVDGYRVTYVYNGQTQTTRLPYDPGDKIRVRVDVHPAE